MTSLMVWIGRDGHPVPSSVYIATDSRISWNNECWDRGRKTFAARSSPDIFGYVGDVLFPSLVLSQFTSALDDGVVSGCFLERKSALETLLRVSLDEVPASQRRAFSVVHCARDGEGTQAPFFVRTVSYQGSGGWETGDLALPDVSGVVLLAGSGEEQIAARINQWEKLPKQRTTRGLFQCFVSALQAGHDPKTGGPPQLVGLWRKDGGHSYGVLHQGKRWLSGMPVHVLEPASTIQWRNELFERADGTSRKRLPRAQPHEAI